MDKIILWLKNLVSIVHAASSNTLKTCTCKDRTGNYNCANTNANVSYEIHYTHCSIYLLLLIMLYPISSFATEKWSDKGNYDITWYNSSKDKFEISNEKELSGLAYLVNNGYATFSGKTITILNDISLSDKIWVPIGNGTFAFQGTLNGNSHEISGIMVERNSVADPYVYYGFFGRVQAALIKNLIVSGKIDWEIENYYTTQCIGGLAAKAVSSTISQCVSNISIDYVRKKTSTHKYEVYLGGFIGYSKGNKYDKCISNSNIYATFGRYGYADGGILYVGGLCACDEESICTYCGTEANLDIRMSDSYNSPMGVWLGGLFGATYRSTIESCYSIVLDVYYMNHENSVIALNFGGLAGSHTKSSSWDDTGVRNCYCIVKDFKAGTGNINTPVRFGGLLCNYTDYIPQGYVSNYSNNNVYFDCAKLSIKRRYDGMTTFSSSEMLTDDFVDELNLFYSLNGKDGLWHKGEKGYPVIWDGSETGKPDAIETVYQDSKTGMKQGKYIIDGKLVIINIEGVKYNIDGTLTK